MDRKEYTGRYFNQESTRAQAVTVVVQSGNIILKKDGHWDNSLIWNTDQLTDIEKEGQKIIIKYGNDYHLEILEVSASGFLEELKTRNPRLQKAHKRKSPFFYVLASFIFLSICFLALFYFFAVPWIIEKVADIFPRSTEVRIGKAMLNAFMIGEKKDENTSLLLNDFFKKSAIKSSYDIKVTVVNSDLVNAFAVPGGGIVVYTGILKKMNSYEELVAMLSHETGHIEGRHSLKLLANQFSLGLMIGAVFQNYGDFTDLLLRRAAELHNLSYNRSSEDEADEYAFNTLQSLDIDPQGMISLFKHMELENKGTPAKADFLLTHPTTEKRIKHIEKLRVDSKKKYLVKTELATSFAIIQRSLKSW